MEMKLEKFEPWTVRGLHEKLMTQNWALRALGALLESADFGLYFDDHKNTADYRGGINQIIEMYLERQEKELEEMSQKTLNCPEEIIRSAFHTVDFISQGGSTSYEYSLKECRKALDKINRLIEQFGADEYPGALNAREKLSKLQNMLFEKTAGVPNKCKTGT